LKDVCVLISEGMTEGVEYAEGLKEGINGEGRTRGKSDSTMNF